MGVNLEYYYVEPTSGEKFKINNMYDIGSIFKGEQKKFPLAIFNSGDETAVSPKAFFTEYIFEGADYYEALTWKKLAFDENAEYVTSLNLPDIKPNSWMTGKEIYYQNFEGYPDGRSPIDDGLTWWVDAGERTVFQAYSGYLEHSEDTQLGRALWLKFPEYKNFTFSTKITVPRESFAGYLLRNVGDKDTGYIVLLNSYTRYHSYSSSEAVIQVWSGKFSVGDNSNLSNTWDLLYQSPSVGFRGTDDFFKVKLSSFDDNGVEKTRFDFWFQNEFSETPLYSFIDSNNTYTSSAQPVLVTDTSANDNIIHFDDLTMEVPIEEGRIWISSKPDAETDLFGKQYSVFRIDYGGV